MATYSVNPNHLQHSGDELRGVSRSIESSMADLNVYVDRYTHANVGETAVAFLQAQQKWNSGLDLMRENIVSAARAIDEIAHNYSTTDQRGAGLFNSY